MSKSNSASLRAMSDEGLLGASSEAILDSAADEICHLRRIIDLGIHMRECQRTYFRTRERDALDLSKKAEAQFDQACANLLAPSLFK